MLNKKRSIKKYIYILFILLVSCNGETTGDTTVTIVEKEKLIPLIVDLQILESHFQRQFSRAEVYRDALDSSSISVFEAHEITKEDFSKSLNYYSEHPDSLYLIYEAALDSINLRLDKINSIDTATNSIF